MEYLFTYISPVNLMVSMKVNRPYLEPKWPMFLLQKALFWRVEAENRGHSQVPGIHGACGLQTFSEFPWHISGLVEIRDENLQWLFDDKQFGRIAWTHCWHSSPLLNWVYFDISLVHWQKTLEWSWLHMCMVAKFSVSLFFCSDIVQQMKTKLKMPFLKSIFV